MAKGTFDQSDGGKPIVVTTVNPSTTVIDRIPQKDGLAYPREYTVTLSNMGASELIVEVHYNNGLIEVTVPAHDLRTIGLTCEGDSDSCGVASPSLLVTIINGSSGTIHVSGGWDDGKNK